MKLEAKHIILGKKGEEAAANYLLKNKYSILEKNWRSKKSKSEIDIIAIENNTLVFVEVKIRISGAIAQPEEAVNKKKINLLIELANIYAEEHNINLEIRFDIIGIIVNKNNIEIKHSTNAFEPNF